MLKTLASFLSFFLLVSETPTQSRRTRETILDRVTVAQDMVSRGSAACQ